MAELRKGRCYREMERPYTRRSRFKTKNFIKVIPPSKIVKFDMGDTKKEFSCKVNLISKDSVQIRNNALESARQIVNRRLAKHLGPLGFSMKVTAYPHHILRENKMITGAGADRMQTGMAHSFGKAIGTAAQVKKGKVIMSVFVNEKDKKIAFDCLKLAAPRLPCQCIVV